MAGPHNPGPSDPLNSLSPTRHPPPSPMANSMGGYQAQQYGYEYEGLAGVANPANGQPQPHPSLQYSVMQQHMQQHGRSDLNIVPVPHHHGNISPSGITPTIAFEYAQGQPPLSAGFYQDGMDGSSNAGSHSGHHDGAFNPSGPDGNPLYLNFPPNEWQAAQPLGSPTQQHPPPQSSSTTGTGKGSKANPNRVPRHQFTACGACRHRRVKCDLRARQEESEREALLKDSQLGTTTAVRRPRVSCTNCQERGTNCVDEYAPLKAAKQLRRGKRISEIEMLYGKSATDAALASQGDDAEPTISPSGRKTERLPELTREFFESSFYRRFHVQRPVVDSLEFVTRYLSKPIPCAAAMGLDGSVLCHALYAWGVSYGVDERGQLDVLEGGHELLGALNMVNIGDTELKRERDRQRRMEKLGRVVRTVLREIDEFGLMRRPSWDGVRSLLLILPLTEGISTPVERQAMYQTALAQVQLLCTPTAAGYDGLPVNLPASPTQDDDDRLRLVRLRIFWYAFVHESITVGLRGGKLLLEEQDDSAFLKLAFENQPLIQTPGHFHTSLGMVTAPIRFALICRRIHSILTGARARRRDLPDVEQLHAVWEALDQSWDEYDRLKNEPVATPFRERDEMIRFADAGKIVLFEAQNVIRRHLENRLELLQAKVLGFAKDTSRPRSGSPESTEMQGAIAQVKHLLDLSQTRCEIKSRQVMDIIREHLGAPLFEWDASVVRDGTFEAALLLVSSGGSDQDINLCLRALNEGRWAHSKSAERSADLRKAWQDCRSTSMRSPPPSSEEYKSSTGPTTGSSASLSRNDSPPTSVDQSSDRSLKTPHSWPSLTPHTIHPDLDPLRRKSDSALLKSDSAPHSAPQRRKTEQAVFDSFQQQQRDAMLGSQVNIKQRQLSDTAAAENFLYTQQIDGMAASRGLANSLQNQQQQQQAPSPFMLADGSFGTYTHGSQ